MGALFKSQNSEFRKLGFGLLRLARFRVDTPDGGGEAGLGGALEGVVGEELGWEDLGGGVDQPDVSIV